MYPLRRRILDKYNPPFEHIELLPLLLVKHYFTSVDCALLPICEVASVKQLPYYWTSTMLLLLGWSTALLRFNYIPLD